MACTLSRAYGPVTAGPILWAADLIRLVSLGPLRVEDFASRGMMTRL